MAREKTPGPRDVGRQVEGIGRLSIIPGPNSLAGRCGTFEGEKRKFLSVQVDLVPTVTDIIGADLPTGRVNDGAGQSAFLLERRRYPLESP